MKVQKLVPSKKQRENVFYQVRQTLGLGLLTGMSILFIAQNLSKISSELAYGISTLVVLLVLFFTLKK